MPFPDISPIAFSLGPFAVRWYALGYLAGVFLGAWYATTLLKRETLWADNKPPFPAPAIWDFAFWAVIGIVVGGRTGYVLFYNFSYYAAHPADIIAVWDGGMSFHGGLIGILIAMGLFTLSYSRKTVSQLPPPVAGEVAQLAAEPPSGAGRGAAPGSIPVVKTAGRTILQSFDLLGCVGTIGIFLVRIANFINGELYGAPTNLPWAVIFPTDPQHLPRHPSQLYEAALEGVVLFLVILVGTRRLGWLKRPGLTGGVFGIGYALSRIAVEFVRLPDAVASNDPNTSLPGYLLGTNWLTMGQVLSLPVLAAGLGLVAYAMARPRA